MVNEVKNIVWTTSTFFIFLFTIIFPLNSVIFNLKWNYAITGLFDLLLIPIAIISYSKGERA